MAWQDRLTVDEQNELSKAHMTNLSRRLRDAFLETFGLAGKRTPHGALILEHLERFASYSKPIREVCTDGSTDIPRHFAREGRREVLQAIHNMIEWRESDHGNPSDSGT